MCVCVCVWKKVLPFVRRADHHHQSGEKREKDVRMQQWEDPMMTSDYVQNTAGGIW